MGAPFLPLGAPLAWRPAAAPEEPAFVEITWCDPGLGTVLVADSFRVAAGEARGLHHHLERFAAGVAAQQARAQSASAHGAASPDVDGRARVAAFLDDAVAAIAEAADAHPDTALFPRIELRERGELRLLLRPSPAIEREVVLATAGHDPRREPTIKGPDLERLVSLRTAAQARGAGEAVIVDARGRVIEGAYSAIVWSRGGRLHVVAADAPRIPSVTERLVLDAARASGRAVLRERPTPDELEGAAVWVLSALHGARAATAWADGPTLSRDTDTDAWLREALDEALTPVRGVPALGGPARLSPNAGQP